MLNLNDIEIKYNNKVIVQNLCLQVEKGEIACLLGPSGEGKTSILRAISGLHNIDAGEIYINDKLVSSKKFNLEVQKRKVGMLFQDYALFPHLNVEQNVAFGIKKHKEYKKTVAELLEMVHMQNFKYRYPHELSGGQQQRVALARALAPNPEILLLDEPFSSLDSSLRQELAIEVRAVLKQHNITAILVTHDQEEAFAMVDKIGVLYQQKLQQWDTPYDLYHKPNTKWVANFIGKGVFIDGIINSNSVEIELGKLKHNSKNQGQSQVDVLLRADDVMHDDNSLTKAKVIQKSFYGADFLYTLELSSGTKIYAYVPSHHNHEIGELIGIYLDVNHVMVFNKND